jgi:hypothetical protein
MLLGNTILHTKRLSSSTLLPATLQTWPSKLVVIGLGVLISSKKGEHCA